MIDKEVNVDGIRFRGPVVTAGLSRTKNTHPKAVKIEELQSWTNTKAIMANTGWIGLKCKVFEDFKKK